MVKIYCRILTVGSNAFLRMKKGLWQCVRPAFEMSGYLFTGIAAQSRCYPGASEALPQLLKNLSALHEYKYMQAFASLTLRFPCVFRKRPLLMKNINKRLSENRFF